jgi:hypothetical protein
MAFGAGTLIAALALVLMEDARRHGGLWPRHRRGLPDRQNSRGHRDRYRRHRGGLGESGVARCGVSFELPGGIGKRGAHEASWPRCAYILGIWPAIGALCGLAALAGFAAFRGSTEAGIAAVSAVAAGAIIAMLVDTLIPEAYEGAHDYSGLITAAGFLLAFALHKTTA